MVWVLPALLLVAATIMLVRWLRTRYDVRTVTDLRDLLYGRLITIQPRRIRSSELPRRTNPIRRLRSLVPSFPFSLPKLSQSTFSVPRLKRKFRKLAQRTRLLFNNPSFRPSLPKLALPRFKLPLPNWKWLAAAALGLVLLGLVWRGPALLRTPSPPNAFVVRVAPFAMAGQDARQGRLLAEQLVAAIGPQLAQPVDLQMLDEPVADVQAALAVAQEQRVDVLIWGSVAEGDTATPSRLRPQLVWLPGAPWVPGTWPGAGSRFVVAPTYDLALEPVNGTIVLPLAVNSIAHLSRGDVDLATAPAQTLMRDHGEQMRAELPATVLMLAHWALGVPDEAEAQARAALSAAGRAEHWNNGGVVAEDNGKAATAEDAFRRAVALAPQFAVGHANLARVLLGQQRVGEALPFARTAVLLLPNDVSWQATLGAAQRANGHLGAARATFDALARRTPADVQARAEHAVLSLTDVVTASGRLEWELEGPPTRTAEQLATLREQIGAAIADTEQRRAEWLQQANSYGVAGRVTMQRVAEEAAARLDAAGTARRYDLLLAELEAGKLEAAQERSAWARLWDGLRGKRTLLEEARATAAALRARMPNRAYDLLCQEGRAAFAGGDLPAAQAAWDAAQALVDAAQPGAGVGGRPEARYGQALLALAAGNRVAARDRFNAALATDARFFPAHQQLATMAEGEALWPEAEAHYRWLAEQRPWDAAGALGLARALRAQDRLADAEQQLLPLANMRNADALILLATIYRSANRLDEAERMLQAAFTIAPNRADLHEERAAVALARGDWQAADSELQQTLNLDQNRTSARVALGRLYVERLGQPTAAVAQLERAGRAEPSNADAQRWLGEALLQTNRADAAVTAFERVLALAPNDVGARHGLAQAYLELGRLDVAQQNEQAALDASNGAFVPAWVGLGDVLQRNNLLPEAQAHYAAALERDPAATGAYLGLARIAAAQGDARQAINYYRRGLQAAPNDVRLLVALGEQLTQTKATREAITVFEQAKQVAPNDAAVHRGLGRALWQAGQGDAALAELDQALQTNPDDADTLLLVGDVGAALGRIDAALDAYNEAARARPRWHEPHYRRGVLLLQQAQTADAIGELEWSLKLNPNVPQSAYWLGRAYRAASRTADAETMFRRAIELLPNYHEARFFLAQTLAGLGRTAEARAVYETILAAAPADDQWRAQAQQALGR